MSATESAAIISDADIPYEQLGRPISGPRALGTSWSRFWHLTVNIAIMDFKVRFFGSALGYLWQLVRPLLLFGVLYVFFTQIAHVGDTGQPSEAFYGTQLLGSLVLFTFFQEATMNSVRCVVENEALVRKIQFPRMAIPLAKVLVALFNLCLNLVVVFAFSFIQGVPPMASWVELPVIMLLLVVLSAGLAMLLSALFVYLRDLQPIWEVILQILFYASPVIVPLSTVQAKLSPTLVHIYMLNPVSAALQQYRHALVTHAADSASYALGGHVYYLLGPALIAVGFLVLGFVVFNRTAPNVAEEL